MLKHKKIFLFDIDRTLAVDSLLYEGSRELLEYIERIGGRAYYITNNSTKSRKDYVDKFARWNLETSEEQFVTASYATCLYLKEHYGGKKLFVMGTPSFVEELRSWGLVVTEHAQEDVSCVVVGFDQSLTYEKVWDACRLLFCEGVDYVGTNPDLRCPTAFGFVPDCGGICEMLNGTVGRRPLYIGKPNAQIVELCLKDCGADKNEVLVVGDRLYTDIACGINAGVDTAVVYTGEATKEEVEGSSWKPDYEFENIMELYQRITGTGGR
ncbi:MAG: HAD-IIA family hydrolase [Bariatricus massiliensis]|nr:HAD-IIA family hydrolase [Bariatricus massiliensis]